MRACLGDRAYTRTARESEGLSDSESEDVTVQPSERYSSQTDSDSDRVSHGHRDGRWFQLGFGESVTITDIGAGPSSDPEPNPPAARRRGREPASPRPGAALA